jgi:hypothetical protein
MREHSLALNSLDEKNLLDHLIKLTPIGGTIDLETPPTAINVKIYPNFPCDDVSTTEYKTRKRNEWKHESITSDGKVIVPIDKKTVKYHNESISACGTPFYLNASTVPMGDHFPIQLGFCITIPKAQGQTIHKLFASLSEHPCAFLRFRYEQIYTLLSHITGCNGLQLLLQMGNRNSL